MKNAIVLFVVLSICLSAANGMAQRRIITVPAMSYVLGRGTSRITVSFWYQAAKRKEGSRKTIKVVDNSSGWMCTCSPEIWKAIDDAYRECGNFVYDYNAPVTTGKYPNVTSGSVRTVVVKAIAWQQDPGVDLIFVDGQGNPIIGYDIAPEDAARVSAAIQMVSGE
jgi:hypothetical protein